MLSRAIACIQAATKSLTALDQTSIPLGTNLFSNVRMWALSVANLKRGANKSNRRLVLALTLVIAKRSDCPTLSLFVNDMSLRCLLQRTLSLV